MRAGHEWRRTLVAAAAATVVLAAATDVAKADVVLTGNVVSVPITVVSPVQVCNNNVAAGVIAVAVDALTLKVCGTRDPGQCCAAPAARTTKPARVRRGSVSRRR